MNLPMKGVREFVENVATMLGVLMVFPSVEL